ncbi:hypothetical protein TNCV_4054161 [Trichonephila clavipes]|nr:hypothetical protein TNCV_4054161 [Trichonephila clavipes]
MSSCDTFCQTFTSSCSRSTIFWGARIWCPNMCQKCSIGERSGDLVGQGRVLKARRQSRDMRTVWSLALSCWKLATG